MLDRERRVLALWERGAGLDRWEREALLLAARGARPPQRIGARNAALLALRHDLFGRAWPLISRCPACNTDSEFTVDSVELAQGLSALAAAAEPIAVEWEGRRIELRPPTVEDLRAIAVCGDAGAAARDLLLRCASAAVVADRLEDQAISELGTGLERTDPAAVVSFALQCAVCGHRWSAAIDVGDALWTEVRRAAEQALVAIDALARAYGWTEREVLRLSPTRRAAYLQLVGAS